MTCTMATVACLPRATRASFALCFSTVSRCQLRAIRCARRSQKKVSRMQPLPDGHWLDPVVRCFAGGQPMQQILVVDNDEGTVEAIAELLRDTGYHAFTATTG